MTNETIDAFLAALPEKRRARAAMHLDNVLAEQVYNADYVDAKFILGRSVDEAWDTLKVPHALYCEIGSVMCLHDVISMSKKVNKAGFNLDVIEPIRAFCAAILPVALLMKDLKHKTIKARKPASAEVQAERAAKAALVDSMPRATCGCCFANQAILPNGYIHDHGYTLPSAWNKSASCYGRNFRPLEVSDEGPKFMVTVAETSEAHMVEAIERLKVATTLRVESKWEHRGGFRVPTEFKDIAVADPEFARIQRERITGTEYRLGACRQDLTKYRKVVAEWKSASK